MNAKYNALLIAKDEYKLSKEIIRNINQDNFGTILPIYYKVDSTKLDSANLFLVDAIKKSSIVAERHSNSKYLDEAYLVLADARLLKQEFYNAIETYKYVNTTAKTNTAKNSALIGLLRAYTENEDYITANQVAGILKGQKLNKENKARFLINKAYYHQKLKEDALAVVFLEEGIKYLKKSNEKARLHYIVGQYYDKLNQPVMARKNYISSKKNKPGYDIEFNANLGLLMNQSLAKNTLVEFETLLSDRKNQDLKDKIYFKMGELEAQKKNYPKAFEYYAASVYNANDDNVQKAFAYKAIADIYFDQLNDFETAAIYYDSTLITIPKEFEDYKSISQRALSLNDFIRYKKSLELEDSLQYLASLNPLELDYKIEKYVAEKHQKEKQVQNVNAIQTNTNSSIYNATGGKRWTMYDPLEIIKQKNDFVRTWGSRPLEDNWRRAEKELGSFSLKIERETITNANPEEKPKTEVNEEDSPEKKEMEREKQEIIQKIPKTPIQIAASKRKQEESYFQLAKIYKLQFNENEKSAATFKTLIEKFPNSVFEPEALYFLTILEPNVSSYSAKLLEKYPYSSFSRQIKKGATKITASGEIEANAIYSNAFKVYESGRYNETLKALDSGLNDFLGSQIEDKMAFLRILTLSKLSLKDQYLISLNDFVRSYPTSDLLPKAKKLLETLN